MAHLTESLEQSRLSQPYQLWRINLAQTKPGGVELNKLDGGDTRAELADYVCSMNIHTCKLKSVLSTRLVGEELKKTKQIVTLILFIIWTPRV